LCFAPVDELIWIRKEGQNVIRKRRKKVFIIIFSHEKHGSGKVPVKRKKKGQNVILKRKKVFFLLFLVM